MSLPQNTSKGKREIRHDAHNRRPGIASFWRNTGERKSRRWVNRINKWRVDGKIALPPTEPEEYTPRKRAQHDRKVWGLTFEDFLSPEEIEALRKIRD